MSNNPALGREIKSVITDVGILEELGLIDEKEEGRAERVRPYGRL